MCSLLFILAGGALLAQPPVIDPDGVVNAASGRRPGGPVNRVAGGSVASIFGSNLASQTVAVPAGTALPRTLAGTTVTFDGEAVPLFYVSPTQINLQVPSRYMGPNDFRPKRAQVVVSSPSGSSPPVAVEVRWQDPGIFTLDGSGCGQPLVRYSYFETSGASSLPLPGSPAAGMFFSLQYPLQPRQLGMLGPEIDIWATGLGAYEARYPPDGQPVPDTPVFHSGGVTVFLGDRVLQPEVLRSQIRSPTKLPGAVGIDWIRVRVPPDVLEGCRVPLWLVETLGGTRSQVVPLSVRRSGGHCIDPPPESLGEIRWVRTVSHGLESPAVSEHLVADFSRALGKRRQPADPGAGQECRCAAEIPAENKPCPGFEAYKDTKLDAGTLLLEGPGFGPLEGRPSLVDGQPIYRVPLPEGTIGEGEYRVRGRSGPDVGTFTTTVKIPPPIEVLTPIGPGTIIRGVGNALLWRVEFRGVPAGAVVRFYFRHVDDRMTQTCECAGAVDAKGGTNLSLRSGFFPPIWPVAEELVIRYGSDPLEESNFGAEGLSLGGRHGWAYEFRYGGVRVSFY